MTAFRQFRSGIALLLIPCLLVDPRLASAFSLASPQSFPSEIQTHWKPEATFNEQALAAPLEFSERASQPMAYRIRRMASYLSLHSSNEQREWVPAVSASMAARWVWSQMADLSWSHPSKYMYIGILGALAPVVVPHEILHVIAAWKLIRSRNVRFNPWGLFNGTPLLMHRGYAGVHPVEPWYIRAFGPSFNLFAAAVGIFTYIHRVPLLDSLLSVHYIQPSFIEKYGFYNFVFLLLEIAVGIATRHGDLFTLMARFRFDRHDTGVLLSVKEGQKQLRNYILNYIRREKATFPPHVGLLRIDPEFGEAIDRRVPPELAAHFRQRIMAMFVEYIREQPVLHDSLLAATESNDEVLLLMPSGVSGTIKEDHIMSALDIIQKNWIRNGYAIYDLEDRLGILRLSEFTRLARRLQERGIYLWRDEESGKSLVLALRPAKYIGKLGYVEPDEKATLDPGWVCGQIATAMPSLASPVDITSEFLAQKQLPNYPIVFSAALTSLSRAEDLNGMELMRSSGDAKHEIVEDHAQISRYFQTLRTQFGLSEEQHANLIDEGLTRILLTLRKSSNRQPDQLRRAAGISLTEAGKPMLTIRVVELHSQSPVRSGNGYTIIVPDAREKSFPILSERDLAQEPLPSTRRLLFDPSQGNRHAELSLRTWLVRLSAAGRIQRMITRAMLMAYFAVMAAPSSSFGLAMVAGLDDSQARLYVQLLQRVFPLSVEKVAGIHNPMPEDLNLPKSYGRPDGNGIAVLQSVRSVYEFLCQKLQPGRNYFRLAGSSLLDDKVHMAIFGGGMSSRAPYGTPGGKAPAVVGFENPGFALGGPATMAHLLSAIGVSMGQAMTNASHAHASIRLVNGALCVIYGDNVTQIDPAQMQAFLETNPEAAEGLTITLRSVPWYEAVKWGVAHIDRNGRILRFFEKPGKDDGFLSEAEVSILMQYIDSKEETLREHADILTGRKGILERLHKYLDDNRLLVNIPGQDEQAIYMNAGFGLLGGESLIRFMKLMGADIRYDADNGDYYVDINEEDPLESRILPFDHALHRARLEIALSTLLFPSLNKPGPREGVFSRDNVLQRLEYVQRALIIPEQGERKLVLTLKEHLRVLQEKINHLSDNDQTEMRAAISETLWQIGQDVSFYEGFVAAGMNLDFFGDIVPSMASGMAKGDFIFSQKKVMGLAKSVPDVDQFLQKIRPRMSSEDPAICDVAVRELYTEMLRCRVEVDGGRMPITGYQALAGAYWRYRIWQTMREKNIGTASPQLYGYVDPRVSTAWLDSGALFEFIQNMTGVTRRGQEIANAYEIQPKVMTNISSPITAHWAVVDPDLDKPENFSPLGYLAASYLGGTYSQPTRTLHIGNQSAVFNAHIPWGFNLGDYRSVFEGVVTRNETPGKQPVYVVTGMIQHNVDKTPGDTDSFMGRKLSEFLIANKLKRDDDTWEDGLWNEPREFQMTGDRRHRSSIPIVTKWSPTVEKQVAFNAKLFPALSFRLMQASFNGRTPEALKAAAQDDLDWDLFNHMEEIWSWLQGDLNAFEEDGTPKEFFNVWQRARKAGRLFSIEDMHTKRASNQLLERRTAILNLAKQKVEAMENSGSLRNGKQPDSPYWISGMDPRKVPKLEDIISPNRSLKTSRRKLQPVMHALWMIASFLWFGSHNISASVEHFFEEQVLHTQPAQFSPRVSSISA